MAEGSGNHFFDSDGDLTATIKGFGSGINLWTSQGMGNTKAFYFAPHYFDGGGFIKTGVSALPSGDSPREISAYYNTENMVPNGWSSLFTYGHKTKQGLEAFGLGVNNGKFFAIDGSFGWSAQVELAGQFASGLYIMGKVPLENGWNKLEVVYSGGPIASSPSTVRCSGEFSAWCPNASIVTSKNIYFIENGVVYNNVAILTYRGGPKIPHELVIDTVVTGSGVGAVIGNDFCGSNFMGSIQNIRVYS
jgi:hypothetical protein